MRRLDGKRFRWFLQVGRVELAQVPRHALIDLCQAALHLRAREVLVAVVDRFELAAVNCDAGLRQQTDHSAKGDKLRTHLADRRSVILAEIGNRLVIGSQPNGEPHDFNVAARLTLKPTARLNSVEITEDVELQQHRRMIRGPPGGLRINPFEPKLRQIEPLNKNVDHPNRVVLANPIFQALRKQRNLLAIHALNEAAHPDPSANRAGIIPPESHRPCVFTQPRPKADVLRPSGCGLKHYQLFIITRARFVTYWRVIPPRGATKSKARASTYIPRSRYSSVSGVMGMRRRGAIDTFKRCSSTLRNVSSINVKI